jgi:hypothetical protein
MTTLTPAEKGILAANLDQARNEGLGDDDTLVMLENLIIDNDWLDTVEDAKEAAYDFFCLTL